jgi:alkanesulfonate monooxygenase SsuD/methylene tetrahydromethanopterin reductase-like flavin-dependent oxidoreductase (luciferase family)
MEERPMTDAPFALCLWSDMRPAPGSGDYARRYAELIAEAQLADANGFGGFWTTENHGVDDGYLQAQLPLLAGLATITSRLRLFTSVYLLPFYNVRQTLESTIVVDLLSQGRMELGVGAGAYKREFELFGADYPNRGRTMEDGLRLLRQGLDEGRLPDGPDGALVPLVPGPAQERLPVLVGGLAPVAVDRAARLGDGHSAYDYEHPEENLPRHWREVVQPALARYDRTLDDFRLKVAIPLWVSDDPERDWEELYRPAFDYQQRKYAEWYGDTEIEAGLPGGDTTLEAQLVGTPEDVARRLLEIWRQVPWHELGFFYRLPGISHERALEHLEMVSGRLMPELARLAAAEGVTTP